MVVTKHRKVKQNDPEMGIAALTFNQLFKAIENGWAWLISSFLSISAFLYPVESVRVALGAAIGFCLLDFVIGIVSAIKAGTFRSKRVPDVVLKIFGYSIAVFVIYTALFITSSSQDLARIVTTILAYVLLLREAVSILEHLAAMGVPLPVWAIKLVRNQLDRLNRSGEDLADTLDCDDETQSS